MRHHYDCIRSRIPEPPKWFDEEGAPRYDDFSPRDAANIYAREAVLLHVECQNCGHPFKVCMTTDAVAEALGRPVLSERVKDGSIHYGDPPNIGCCPSGPTMNSVPRRVLEFWRYAWNYPESEDGWGRVPALEIAIEPDWASDSGGTER